MRNPANVLLRLLPMVVLGCHDCITNGNSDDAPLGDYGDAPDRGLSAGYYGLAAQPLGILSDFPVQFDTKSNIISNNVGLFTRSGSELFIDNLYSLPPNDPPSLELGVEDPNDPDGPPNPCSNNVPTAYFVADHDVENAIAPRPCPPSNPSTPIGPANAYLFILAVSVPPVAFFTTAAYASPGFSGTAYWNVLFDNDQNGAWSTPSAVVPEWVVSNQQFTPVPGSGTLLVSAPFAFGRPGFGALAFPMWVRNVVATTPLSYSVWDGSGPKQGLESGEVEDYFLEWRPIGQRKDCPAQGCNEGESSQAFPAFSCPERAVRSGGIARTTCPIPQTTGFQGILVACAASGNVNATTTGTPFTRIMQGTATACAGFAPVTIRLEPAFLALDVGPTETDIQVIIGLAPTDGRNVTVGSRVVIPRQ